MSTRQLTVLFLPLEPPASGLVHRGSNMLRMLRTRHQVIGLERAPNFGSGRLRYVRLLRFWLANARLALAQRGDIDLVFAENIHAVGGGLIAKRIGRPCIQDMEGDDHLWAQAWAQPRLYARLVLGLDRLAGRWARCLLVPCEEDRQGYQQRGHCPERAYVVPLCTDTSEFPPLSEDERAAIRHKLGLAGKPVLIYTGNRTERPYRLAAEWICERLAPGLARRFGDAFTVVLTGRGPLPSIVPPQVLATGHVPNFLDYLAAADVCLAPLWIDTGMPGKVVEYAAAGKAIVVSSRVRGFPELEDGVNALIAEDEDEYVTKVELLMREPALARALGARAREMACQHYSLERGAQRLLPIVEQVAAERRGR